MKPLIDRLHEKFTTSALQNTEVIPDVEEWHAFLDALPEPVDSIDVAHNKYDCRMHYFSTNKKLLINFIALCAMPIVFVCILLSNKSIKSAVKGKAVLEKSRDVPNFDDVVPNEIFEEYDVEVVENFNSKFGILCKEGRKLLLNTIVRYPSDFFFIYFVYLEVAAHSHFLLNYNPEATVVYVNERNVASSIITELYENDGRKFISFMHGEYLLQLMQAYTEFSEFYIWDDEYKNIFRWLKWKTERYVTYTPKKLMKKWNLEKLTPEYFCTYYLSSQSNESIYNLGNIMNKLESNGYKCKVRPHPRDLQHLKEELSTFSNIDIEDSRNITLEQSLGNTRFAIGLNTTVLSEAFVEGREIVIDDISDRKKYEDSVARMSVILKKKHILLSNLLKSYL